MTHPLIPEIANLANPIAEKLNLTIVDIIFQTNKNPPVLRIDIQNRETDTSLDNCEQMSLQLDEVLENKGIIPYPYILEISSPGVSDNLTSDRDFLTFKSFPVLVETNSIYKKSTQWQGNLQGRDEQFVYLNCKGKIINIPREIVIRVTLETKETL
jgi:ribosome maturation factor RimP